MKNLVLPLIVLAAISCNQKTASKAQTPIKKEVLKQKAFETIVHPNKGIFLTENIQIYDNKQNVIREIEDVYGQLVTIDSISKLKFDLTGSDDRCKLHNFVKVKCKRFSGWVYGDFLFEKEKYDRIVNVGRTGLLIPTKNFNIGVYDEEVECLSFCGDGNQSPVLFYNGTYKKYEYLPIFPKNENYSEGYLTLDDHDGWQDKAKSFSSNGITLKLTVYRQYQEGGAVIDLEIDINNKQSTCKVVKVVKDTVY